MTFVGPTKSRRKVVLAKKNRNTKKDDEDDQEVENYEGARTTSV